VARLAKLSVDMQAHYGAAKVCKPKAVAPKPAKYAKPAKGAAKPSKEPEVEQVCMPIGEVSKILAESRKPADLLEAWRGWHDTARPLRADFEEFVRLANEGAREIGFADVGALWRSGYDMTPDELEADVERMWQDVKPLYDRLHCYVRGRLQKKYGADVVPSGKPIPAHLLGNLWAQEWVKLYDVLAPYPGEGGLDVSKSIASKRWTSKEMVRAGESFFTSLGFQPLPESFWSRSLFDKPKDRDVVCHASAWDLDLQKGGDLRIKMCIEPTEEDLVTIHHELGHVFYYQAYTKLPVLFQAGANDGFHEGIGDAIALGMTPAYYQRLGLLGAPKSTEKAELNFLLKAALERVAFLPFGMLIDKWRWDVFSGKTPPAKYNEAWWELRRTYQGVAPAVARTEADFDAGAKYHVPANVPYVRYFLARLYQFQFHEALCKAAGHTGPLHTCSIFASEAAGKRLRDMLALGASKPWPEAMQAIAGSKKGDAKPMLEYFAPLSKWLDEQNKGQACGW
jgi:peptidyl-dipeptidase A